VLVVCTGNICRSALAERLGRAYLDDRPVEGRRLVQMASAAWGQSSASAMHADSSLVLQGYGGDPDGFKARQLIEDMATGADLTLTMARFHRRRVLELAPRALSRTFALRGRRPGRDAGRRPRRSGADLAARSRNLVRALHEARSGRQASVSNDIADPIGQPLEVHEEVGGVIGEALLPILARIPVRTYRRGRA
jgi:protein-tyrosine phosphatase